MKPGNRVTYYLGTMRDLKVLSSLPGSDHENDGNGPMVG